MFWSETAYAHPLYDNLPKGTFSYKWDFDPTLIFFVAMIFAYIRGLGRFKGKKPVQKWQQVCFFIGAAACISALTPPIDPMADQLFFVHMIQHMAITSIGVPLMLLGVPFFVALRGAPVWFLKKVYKPSLRIKPLWAVHRFLLRPLPALIFFEFNFLGWHLPTFYNLALMNDFIHLLEHAMMAMSSIYLWRNIIDPAPMKAYLPLPARMIFIACVEAANIILSSTLTFAKTVWYAYADIPQPGWWQWGKQIDQQLGGLIMWIPGGMIHIGALTAVFFVWAHRTQKKDREQQEAEGVTIGVKPSILAEQKNFVPVN